MMRITGSKVKAPRLEPSMLSAINMPKYWSGTISENTRTRNPAETEITLIIMAFPVILREESIASLASPESFQASLKCEIT
jgi:hypothetical protein